MTELLTAATGAIWAAAGSPTESVRSRPLQPIGTRSGGNGPGTLDADADCLLAHPGAQLSGAELADLTAGSVATFGDEDELSEDDDRRSPL